MRVRLALLAASALAAGWVRPAQEPARSPAVGLAGAARAVLESLTPEQRGRMQHPLGAPEYGDWHFTPRERPGLALVELDAVQRQAVEGLLVAALGPDAAARVGKVRELDTVLREMAEARGERADHRNALLYDLAIFGEPSAASPWALRFEGHHVSATVVSDGAGNFGLTPAFLGANPRRVPEGPRAGAEALREREDAARALFRALDAEQRAAARVAAEPPRDLLLPPGAALQPPKPSGVRGDALTAEQRVLLETLLRSVAADLNPDLGGGAPLEDALAHLDATWFAWSGSAEPGALHGFQIRTPRFFYEWTTTQGDANHVHACLRDLERDATLGWGMPPRPAR